MPTWGEILTEINSTAQLLRAQGHLNVSPFDIVRRKYLALIAAQTNRATILYASGWLTNPDPGAAQIASVTEDDMLGFMEAVHGLTGPNLDLILHSPGGSGGAAEQIVKYLRTKFDNIRIIVPHMAMSAATMIACAADKIVMGKHSFLGPIDPQFLIQTALGPRYVPGQAILEQFERALKEASDMVKLRAWAPMLSQYGPDLLVTCQNMARLSEDLVSEWLTSYMFRGQTDAGVKGKEIAHWLSDHSVFKTHARPISRDELIGKGVIICDLERDQVEQDLFLSIHHAASHTFASTPAVKIIENHRGKAYVRSLNIVQQILVPAPVPTLPQPPAQPPAAPA
jgi:hypothetical protein